MRPPRSQRPQARLETFLTEAERPRLTSRFFYGSAIGRRRREATSPDMHVIGESDSFIVPKKPANKGGVPQACGVGGGKETDQGEHRAIATGPDTEPEIERETVCSQVARIVGCT